MRLLAIDTSNQTLTLAVSEDQQLLGEYTMNVKKNHSLSLMPAISKLVSSVGLLPNDIDRIVVAKGPGSYTGLRIGVTTAKTLAYTMKKELVGISSLKIIAANCFLERGPIVPLFDARRNNVYTGCYEYQNGVCINTVADQHIDLKKWLGLLKTLPTVYFVGEDVIKFKELIQSILPHARFNEVPTWQIPSGRVLAELGRIEKPSSIHDFLPDYLKRVEAEENWLKDHKDEGQNYVEKI